MVVAIARIYELGLLELDLDSPFLVKFLKANIGMWKKDKACVTLYERVTKGVKLPFIATHEIKLDQAVKFQIFLFLLLCHIKECAKLRTLLKNKPNRSAHMTNSNPQRLTSSFADTRMERKESTSRSEKNAKYFLMSPMLESLTANVVGTNKRTYTKAVL